MPTATICARSFGTLEGSCVVQMIRYSAMTSPNHSRLTTLVRSLVTIRTWRQTVVIVVKPDFLAAVSTAVSSPTRLFSNVVHSVSLLNALLCTMEIPLKHYSRAVIEETSEGLKQRLLVDSECVFLSQACTAIRSNTSEANAIVSTTQ